MRAAIPRQSERVDDERAHHEQELQGVEGSRPRLPVARRDRVEQHPEHEHQKQVEADEDLTFDVDAAPGPDHRHQEGEQHEG